MNTLISLYFTGFVIALLIGINSKTAKNATPAHLVVYALTWPKPAYDMGRKLYNDISSGKVKI